MILYVFDEYVSDIILKPNQCCQLQLKYSKIFGNTDEKSYLALWNYCITVTSKDFLQTRISPQIHIWRLKFEKLSKLDIMKMKEMHQRILQNEFSFLMYQIVCSEEPFSRRCEPISFTFSFLVKINSTSDRFLFAVIYCTLCYEIFS